MSLRRTRNQSGQFISYQYDAHASNISDLCVVITRKKIHHDMNSTSSQSSSNPYHFKPKSYSTKKSITLSDISQKLSRYNLIKKNKKQSNHLSSYHNFITCHLSDIFNQIKKGHNHYFHHSFIDNHYNQEQYHQNHIQESSTHAKSNNVANNQIFIVSNQNQKISTIIHPSLLYANTTHAKIGKDQHFLQSVTNPFNFQRRNHYLKSIKFQKYYKSGYAPIQMQQKNTQDQQDITQNYSNQITKTHFIRKKQCTLSLPRSCGVSYIKPSQSFQTAPFEPLPPLIFQCSSRCLGSKDLKDKYQNISTLFNTIFQTNWLPLIHSTQQKMRDLLLGKKIGDILWVKGIQNIWPLFNQGNFFLFPFTPLTCLTDQDVWRAFGQSLFKIGILVKKSTSGKKALLRSLNIKQKTPQDQLKQQKKISIQQKYDFHENPSLQKLSSWTQTLFQQQHKSFSLQQDLACQLKDCRTVITLSLRLQMYLQQQQWKNSSKQSKSLLNVIITNLKDILQKNSLDVIQKRFTFAKSDSKQGMIKELSKNIRQTVNKETQMQSQNLNQSNILTDQQNVRATLQFKQKTERQYQSALLKQTETIKYQCMMKNNKVQSTWQKTLKMPLYYISTRDSFAFDLVERITQFQRQNHIYKRIQYFFQPQNLPTNYGKQYKQRFPDLNVGVTCYHNFFTNKQLIQFQTNTFKTQIDAFKNKFLQMTVQPSIVGCKIKRTKFFFGYRYMWTKCQLAQPGSYIGAGVRKDVASPPKWTQTIINKLVKSNIVQKDFINSIAINVYHDGKQGLAQHFDDAVRFRQPIFTIRLFSDSRLSFGSQFYGFCNGAFIVPLPRGCICVMEQNSYAANGVKHCVRPCDMTGKSAAVILRQMHHKVVSQAKRFDQLIDFPSWISCLSNSVDAITYAEQKRRQAQYYINNPRQDFINR